jgi:hypothetical protein
MVKLLESEREELIEKKKLLIKDYISTMKELNNSSDTMIDNAMRDHPRNLDGGIDVLNKVKGFFKWSKNDELKIMKKDGLKYADSWMQRKKEEYEHMRDALEKNQESVLKDYDNAIQEKTKEIKKLRNQIQKLQNQIGLDNENLDTSKSNNRWNQREVGKTAKRSWK